MNKYIFNIHLVGFGDTPESAWIDAVESTNLDNDSTPDKDDIIIVEEED